MKINREIATGQEIRSNNCHLIVAKAKPEIIESFGTVREVWFIGKAKDFKKVWGEMIKKLATVK